MLIKNFARFMQILYKKNRVWKPTFNVIVSNCTLKSFDFGTIFSRVIKILVF